MSLGSDVFTTSRFRCYVLLASALVLALLAVLFAAPSQAMDPLPEQQVAVPSCVDMYFAQPVGSICSDEVRCLDGYVTQPVGQNCACYAMEIVTVDGETVTFACSVYYAYAYAYTYADSEPTEATAAALPLATAPSSTPEQSTTPEPQPTVTPEPTSTSVPKAVPDDTVTATATSGPVASVTATATSGPVAAVTATATSGPVASVTATATSGPVASVTATATSGPVASVTATATSEPTVAEPTPTPSVFPAEIIPVQSGATLQGTVSGPCPCAITVKFSNGVTVSTVTRPDGSWSVPLAAGSSGAALVSSAGVTATIVVTLAAPPVQSTSTPTQVIVLPVDTDVLVPGVVIPVAELQSDSQVVQPPLALTGAGTPPVGSAVGLAMIFIGLIALGWGRRLKACAG